MARKETSDADDEKGIDGTPQGQAARWRMEFRAAREKVKQFQKRGDIAVKRFLDEREENTSDNVRLNVYTANIQTMRCIMYGKTPRVDASRRFADSSDDVARVSAEILERVLNADIQKDGDTYADACGSALDDRLIPGGGIARVRYVAELEDVEPEPDDLDSFSAPPAPEQMEPDAYGADSSLGPVGATALGAEAPEEPEAELEQRKSYECVEVDYVHWRDFLWSVGRTWADTRWVAFAADIDKREAEKQFGADVAAKLPWSRSKEKKAKGNIDAPETRSPWAQVRIWEIWSKEDRSRYFFAEGYGEVLKPIGVETNEDGSVEDPLGLDGFFPCPKPMFANTTSNDFLPTSDLYLTQDLLLQIDDLFTRIKLLQDAVALRGAYDKSNDALKQLLTETGNKGNELIPVAGLKLLMAGGGDISKSIMWLPIDMVVNALSVLREMMTEKLAQYDQVSGFSDVTRGESAQQTTATEAGIKARFASVRIQTMQDEFARFCSDLQRLKAEIISKHYDEATLLEAANMAYTPDSQDPQLVQKAVALIKANHFAYRIEVKPESISLTDYAALKNESMEVLQGIGAYLQMAAPLGQAAPQLGPMLLQLLQWTVSRIRGSQEIEGLLDRAISQAQAAQQQQAMQPKLPPPPDPKVQAQAMKAQADQQHTQGELQADLVRTRVETQAQIQAEVAKAHIGVAADAAKQRNASVAALNSSLNPQGTVGV